MLVISLLVALPAVALTSQDPFPYEDLAHEFLESHGLDGKPPGQIDLEAIFPQRFAHVRLGGLEVLFPSAALAEKGPQKDLKTLCRAMLAAQELWLDWIDPQGEGPGREAASADIAAIDGWVRSWKKKDLEKLTAGGEDLLAELPAKDMVREAALRLAAYMETGGPLELVATAPPENGEEGDELEKPIVARVILVPTRVEIVRFACAVGWIREKYRSVYWASNLSDWIEFRFDQTRVIALKFPPPQGVSWEHGVAMDGKNPKGLEEQVIQLALGSLAMAWIEDRMDSEFLVSLCNNLVIEMYGEVDTRSDGDLRPRSAPPRSTFVPGGQSFGGSLPPNSAENPWRGGRGSDHFIRVLRNSQKLGGRDVGDKKVVHAFRILSDDTVKRFAAKAPFLGSAAASTELPPGDFRGDWLELTRCYRIAFVHWLREHGAGKKIESRLRFGELLALAANREEAAGFAASFERVYGKPMSASPPAESDLEGSFLAWLAKQ